MMGKQQAGCCYSSFLAAEIFAVVNTAALGQEFAKVAVNAA